MTPRGLPVYLPSVGTYVTPNLNFLTASSRGGWEVESETPIEDVVDDFFEQISDEDMSVLCVFVTRHGQMNRMVARAMRSVFR